MLSPAEMRWAQWVGFLQGQFPWNCQSKHLCYPHLAQPRARASPLPCMDLLHRLCSFREKSAPPRSLWGLQRDLEHLLPSNLGAPRCSFLPRFSPSVCCSRGLAVLALSRTGQAGHRAALTAPHRDSHQPLGSDSWNTGNQERERPLKCPATLACRAHAGYPGMRGKAGGPLARGEAGAGPW